MSRRIRNMYTALEAYEELEPSMPIEEAEVGIATSDAEISEIQANIDAHEDAMNTLVEDQKTIDNLEAQVNQTVQSGEGTTEENAELVQVVVESIFRRHGLGRRNYPRVNLSNESFKTKADRVKVARKLAKNLRVSKEGIGQAIADVIAKICEFFRDLFKKLMGKSNYSSGSSGGARDALRDLERESEDGKNTPVVFNKQQLINMLNQIKATYRASIDFDNKGDLRELSSIKELGDIPIVTNKVIISFMDSCSTVITLIKERTNIINDAKKTIQELGDEAKPVADIKTKFYTLLLKNTSNSSLISRIQEAQERRKQQSSDLDFSMAGIYEMVDESEGNKFVFENVTVKTLEEINSNTTKASKMTSSINSEINKFVKISEEFSTAINSIKAKMDGIISSANSANNTNNEGDEVRRAEEANSLLAEATSNIATITKDTNEGAARVTNVVIDNEAKLNNITTNAANETKEVIRGAKKVPYPPPLGMRITATAYKYLNRELLKPFFDKSPEDENIYVCTRTK